MRFIATYTTIIDAESATEASNRAEKLARRGLRLVNVKQAYQSAFRVGEAVQFREE